MFKDPLSTFGSRFQAKARGDGVELKVGRPALDLRNAHRPPREECLLWAVNRRGKSPVQEANGSIRRSPGSTRLDRAEGARSNVEVGRQTAQQTASFPGRRWRSTEFHEGRSAASENACARGF